jgi:hypothetical protein
MADDDLTPYSIKGLCSRWPNWEQRAALSPCKPAYRCIMVVSTIFGLYVVPGRLLNERVRLSRGAPLARAIRGREEFETSPLARKKSYSRPIFAPAATISVSSTRE